MLGTATAAQHQHRALTSHDIQVSGMADKSCCQVLSRNSVAPHTHTHIHTHTPNAQSAARSSRGHADNRDTHTVRRHKTPCTGAYPQWLGEDTLDCKTGARTYVCACMRRGRARRLQQRGRQQGLHKRLRCWKSPKGNGRRACETQKQLLRE